MEPLDLPQGAALSEISAAKHLLVEAHLELLACPGGHGLAIDVHVRAVHARVVRRLHDAELRLAHAFRRLRRPGRQIASAIGGAGGREAVDDSAALVVGGGIDIGSNRPTTTLTGAMLSPKPQLSPAAASPMKREPGGGEPPPKPNQVRNGRGWGLELEGLGRV